MNFINSLTEKHFTLNGIEYFKNYVSAVYGNKIEVYNCYERKDVLIPLTHFSEFSVGGSVYGSALELQAALLEVTYSRLTIGDSSAVDQNNTAKIISVGMIGPAPADNPFFSPITAVEQKLNAMQINITAKQTPVIVTALLLSTLGGSNFVSKYYKFLFKPGRGNWGLNGTEISFLHLELISVENYLVDDLLRDPNAIIENLGTIPDGNFVTVANAAAWDFTESGMEGEAGLKTYYFSYETNDVLYFVQFVGPPDLYGIGYEAQFTANDFVSSTDSRITDISNFEEVLEQGGNINVSQLTNDGDGTSPYATLARVNGLFVTVNQAAAELYLKNSDNVTLATVNLGFLNNEGTTFFYNNTTEKLELRNDAGVTLSEIPVSAFISNLIHSVEFNAALPHTLEFKDAEGNIVDSVVITINNIEALQAILNGKAEKDGSNSTGTWPINITGTSEISNNSSNWIPTLVSDFNVPTGFKLLEANSGALNRPGIGVWGQGIQFSTNSNPAYVNQLVFDVNGNLHTRSKNNGVWNSWSAVAIDQNTLHKTGNESKSGNLTIEGNNRGLYLGNSGNTASILYNENGNLDITPPSGYNTIFSEGKIGVGIDPEYKLDVNGNIRANSTLAVSQTAIFGGEITIPNGTQATSAVNKSQLDSESLSIKNAMANDYIPKMGDVTKYGSMTFTESPILPDATLNNHPITKKQLDSAKFIDYVFIKSTNYTVNTTSDIGQTGIITVYINAILNDVTITLPDILQASDSYTFNFKRIDSSNFSVKIASTMTIDGQAFVSLGYLHSVTIKKAVDKYWVCCKYTP